MDITYDVRIYKTDVYRGARTTTYKVRWKVARKEFKRPFKTTALAESFRSDLTAAARKGEAFRITDGLPVSIVPLALGCRLVRVRVRVRGHEVVACGRDHPADARGGDDSGNRRDADRQARQARRQADSEGPVALGFNTGQRDSNCPEEVQRALKWAKSHTHKVSALRDPELLRSVLDALALRLDGEPGAPSVVRPASENSGHGYGYAVELGILECNQSRAQVDPRRKPPM